jgi:hypothetical protein
LILLYAWIAATTALACHVYAFGPFNDTFQGRPDILLALWEES